MSEQTFPWAPVTVEMPGSGIPLSIAFNAYYDPEDQESSGKGSVGVEWEYDSKQFDVGEILNKSDQEMRIISTSGRLIIVRPTRPEDAAISGQFTQPYDLPVEVIGAIMTSAIPSDTNLTAAIDDEGDVHTCLLETNLGLFARYGGQWIKITDTAAIEHLNVVDIADDDLNLYDEADINGQMVNITAMTPTEREVTEVIQEPAQPVTASVPTRAVVVASLDDVPGAIRYAESEEGRGSRWYVARRAKALGWTDPMPWAQ